MNGNGHKKRTQRDYYWVCAVEPKSGRPVVQGPHNNEYGARNWGLDHMKGFEFEVLAFPTINKMAARDYYKNALAERGDLLPIVFKRAIYPKGG